MQSSFQPQSASAVHATTERWSRPRSGGSAGFGAASAGFGVAAAGFGAGSAGFGVASVVFGVASAGSSARGAVSLAAAPGLGLAHAAASAATPIVASSGRRRFIEWTVSRARAARSPILLPMVVRPSPWLLGAVLLLLPACKEDEGGDDGPSDPSGPSNPGDPPDPPESWMVGDAGEMLRVSSEGDASTYPLDHAGDLAAIACHGTATAWVVGEGAAVLLSRDAGETWDPVDVGLPVTAHLRDVAVAHGQPEGAETLVIVGDDGVVLHSTDGGRRFTALEGPSVDWTAAATDALGELAVVAGEDGSLWRSDAGAPLVQLLAGGGEGLHDVAVSSDGRMIVAVGEAGLLLASHDGGERFEPLPPATALDLHAVQLGSDHTTLVAVGEAGVVVRIDVDGAAATSVQETLGPDDALLDLHLRADGLGQAVGTRGRVLLTTDAGRTWDPVETGRTVDLRGVDDFHHAPHL